MDQFTTGGKSVSVFPAAEPGVPVIYLNAGSGEGQQVYEVALAAGCPPFALVAIGDLGWNRDLAPWDSPEAFKGGEPFTGGADDYLRLLVGDILPRAESGLTGAPAWRGIVGYSLAGLFALYAILSDGHIFPGGQHLRLPVVSRMEGICPHAPAKTTAGLCILLLGR